MEIKRGDIWYVSKAKCEMLQTMYESLLNRVLAGKEG